MHTYGSNVIYALCTAVHLWVPVCVCRLPGYASKFLEMCLMVTADHGPAVSGAHNTIVCARAGKDLISSLASGLFTIVSHRHGDDVPSPALVPLFLHHWCTS